MLAIEKLTKDFQGIFPGPLFLKLYCLWHPIYVNYFYISTMGSVNTLNVLRYVYICTYTYMALLKYLRGKFLLIIGWILGTFYIFIWYFMTYNSMIQGPNKMPIQRHRLAAEGRWNLHWKSRENTAIANTLSRFGKHFKLGTLLWCRKGSLSLCGTFCTKCFQETSFKTTSTWVRFLNSKDNLRWPW